MKKQITTEEQEVTQDFEELYIYSFSEIRHHISLLLDSYEDIHELLIQTYVDVYYLWQDVPKREEQISWVKGIADALAETNWDITQEEINSLYMDHDKDDSEKETVFIDETSVFLSIEERLGLMEESTDTVTKRTKILSGFQGLCSGFLLIAAIVVLTIGIGKIREQLNVLKEPLVKPLAEADEESQKSPEEERQIQVGGKMVYLSEIGQVLYSLPIEETSLNSVKPENPEIQKQAGWTYYLPCPERKDTELAEVAPSLYHTLYRMRTDGANEIEIIDREVENYTFWENSIYVSQFDRIQRIDMNGTFEKQALGIYPEVENQEIYLYDTLGRTLRTDSDGSISFGDRILRMSSNRVVDVEKATQKHGSFSYYFKHVDNKQSKEIYRGFNGREEIFVEWGNQIDSFCLVGDWLYFSTYVRNGDSGAHYSELYKKALTRSGEPVKIREEFTGRILQMYYSETEEAIYAHYIPRDWESNHGVIAVISANGQMSILNDEVLRAEETTSGNDMLKFVLVHDNQVYCFWEDGVWKPGEDPVTIWRKVLVVPDSDRIQMTD